MSIDGVIDLDRTFPTADGEPAGPCIQCNTLARRTTHPGLATATVDWVRAVDVQSTPTVTR